MAPPPETDAAVTELLRGVLEEARGLGVLLFDVPAGKILFVNREAREILASVGAEPSFAPLAGLLLGGPSAEREPPAEGETRELRFDGRRIGFTVYGDERLRLVFCRDVSAKLRATSIEESLEMAGSFHRIFSVFRHEIGNPVNSVKTALAVLRSGYDRFSREAVLGYLDRSLAELSRIEELLAALKSFHMQDAVRARPVPLAPLLEAFVTHARAEAEEQGVALELAVSPGAGAAQADPEALRRILEVLVRNALHAVAGRAFARVRVAAWGGDALVRIRVHDNGRGLSSDEVRALFLPFAVRQEGRLGMGLVIARKLLAEMQGTIEVDSTEGAGTEVTVTLRRAEAGA